MWEEEKHKDGVKWKSLEHKGPVFATDYEPLPGSVKFKYNGKDMNLCTAAEEVASFYGAMLDHDYVTKDVFNKNFFKDWRKFMTHSEKEIITDLKKCDFTYMLTYFKGMTSLIFQDQNLCKFLFYFLQLNLKRGRIGPKRKSSS